MSEKTDETVTELLRRQHEEVKTMFSEFENATGENRNEVFDCLRMTLAVHETAEEEVVHPAVRRMGDDAEQAVKARLAEESEAKQVLSDLEKLGPDGDGFDAKFAEFRKAVLAHAEAEETEVFPRLEAEKDQATLQKMAAMLRAAEAMAPTHPHPHGPESAIGNMVVGPVVAVIDQVRDAIKAATKG